MKILNIGSCNIDYVYTLDHIVAPGETENTTRMDVFPGGKGLNQSIAAARAGGAVYHAGCVGNDAELLTDTLRTAGVDISFLKTVDVKNGCATIQVSRTGENAIFLHAGSNAMVDRPLIDRVLAAFSAGDLLLLQNEISNVPYIVDRAHERGLRVIFNPSPINEQIQAVELDKLDYLVLNEREAQALAGDRRAENAFEVLRKRFPSLGIVLTLGEKGCLFAKGEQTLFQSAFQVAAVDTTAAGDTFLGYFAAGLARGEDIPAILTAATAAAAIAVSRHGAAPSIPWHNEVLQALPSLRLRHVNNRTDQLRHIIETYLSAHLQDADLSGLSQALGYSVVYTGTLVRSVTGDTFTTLLQKKRCHVAAELLRETDRPVAEIIRTVGYENETFFRRAFRATYGINPLAYRKRHLR
ncbi:MAG: helix-turn-helix domain-containing protein [Ruminococcaceae bacterium]|nr:helix-turn-helix domain-containing protein [Oscillospiraceae bacterium]